MPMTRSRFSRARATACSGEAHLMSSSSPTRLLIIPSTAMFRNARILVLQRSMTYLRRPGNVWAPAEPASTAVVTPRPRQCSSGSIP